MELIFYSSLDFMNNLDRKNFDKTRNLYKDKRSLTPYYAKPKETSYSISSNINYTLYLLDTREGESIECACKILENILNAQITDVQSDFYGTWLYDFDDTRDKYVSPDYVAQSEIISLLMEIYFEFKDYLPEKLVSGIKESCCRSAFTIIHHCHEIDTATVLLEIFSLISIGEQFDKTECINFGAAKMQTLLYYTLYNDAFMEYNYPEKILIFLEASKFFKGHINNRHCLSNIQTIEKILWTCFYSHFNPRLIQWTGPISSTMYDFLPPAYIRCINNLTGVKNPKNIKIPAEYYDISPMSGENFTQMLLTRGFSYPHWKFPTVASFYNSPEFSLGSFNREDMWAQRRPLIAYFGSSNSVYCMRIRCLLNGHDFSSATLHTVQHKGTVLGHITFSTNRGNLHIANDHEKSYKMTDLRVRFQISGNSSSLECSNVKNSLTVFHKLLTIHFSSGYAAFGKNAVTYQLTSTPDAIYFDTIFYSGEEKKLCISQLKEAIMEFSVLMSRDPQTTPAPVITERDGEFLISEQKTDDVSLKLKTPFKPGMIEYTTLADRQYINNVRLERHVDTNKKLSGQYRFIAESNLSPSSAISTSHSAENKKYVTKIKNLSGSELENIDKAVANLLPGLDRFSLDIARRYSIHIIAGLFDAAKKSDVRFKNLIETKYSQIYDEISYTAKIGKMKKMISELTMHLQHDYKRLLTNTKKSNKIAKVIEIINNEYKNPDLSLQMISSQLGISQAHLSREFHSTIGQSYVAYLLKIRMENAKKLLSSGKNINEVITECGYISSVTFNAAFKRYTGMTAKKYLNAHSRSGF